MKRIQKARAGVTLIELILSIAIIGIIVVSFIPLFVITSNTNSKSQAALKSTYLGKDAMEVAYTLSRNIDYEKIESDLEDRLEIELKEQNYSKIPNNERSDEDGFWYKKDDKYLNIKFTKTDNLVKVIVKVYKHNNRNELEVQYESLYSWKGKGILSEK